MSTFVTVFLKELKDSLRDRRTITMIFVASIVTGPLVLVLLSNFISNLTEKAEARRIYVAGKQFAPTAINFFLRQSADVIDAPGDYRQRVKDGKLDTVIIFDKEFESELHSGRTASVELLYDDSNSSAAPSIGLARRLLAGFGREMSALRLMARGVSPEVTAVVKIENTDVATPKQSAARLLFIIPMATLILCVTSGMAVAIDCTAGERERGSLEPLLQNPVKVGHLVAAKWSAVTLYSTAVVFLGVLGYLVTLLYLPFEIDLPLNFGWHEFGLFLLVFAPLSALMAGVLMLVATFGRSYKEAQTYASYVMTLVSFVPAIAIFSSLKDSLWQLFVPALATNMVAMRVLRGEAVGPEHFLIPSLVAIAGAVVCLFIVSRLLRREEIIFGRS
jgi:sodium transport system permease protein